MKVCIYPGSFNPWHDGHVDVIKKALLVFDKVVVAIGKNPEKNNNTSCVNVHKQIQRTIEPELFNRVEVTFFEGLLTDYLDMDYMYKYSAVIRGIRNTIDFEYEKNLQYHYEDLGLKIPVIHLISDRKLVHISSSAIKSLNKVKND